MNLIEEASKEQQSQILLDRLKNKEATIAVIGLGYVGLNLAVYLASQFKVIGYDTSQEKVDQINRFKDPSNLLEPKDFEAKDLQSTTNSDIIANANFYIIAVPTPIDIHKKPNLIPLQKATRMVAKYLKVGDIVVFESTVYPGCTKEVCIPILEKYSNLQYIQDFSVGYSPERVNPGDRKNTFTKIKKVISAEDSDTLEILEQVYGSILENGVHKVSSIEVAEAAKIVENTQRDVNIALMNQLSKIFIKMNINTTEVIKAASTKWNFHKYHPGLVGGHCIGVDPYYLIYKANNMGIDVSFLDKVREVNESMIDFVISQIDSYLHSKNRVINKVINSFINKPIRILVKGVTFKENVNDIRNSKQAQLSVALVNLGYEVCVEDPYANSQELDKYYGLTLVDEIEGIFDVVILSVDHDVYGNLDYQDYLRNAHKHTLFFDIKGNKRHLFPAEVYACL